MDSLQVIKLYDEEYSVREIADLMKTNYIAIYRILKKSGKKLRNASLSQKISRKKQEGTRQFSDETKDKLSKIMGEKYANMTKEERKKFVNIGKKAWESKSNKEDFLKKSNQHLKETMTKGSKLERFIFSELSKIYKDVRIHEDLPGFSKKMRADIYIADISLVIEIDGPSHYEPIFGTNRLKRQQKADENKNAALAANKINLIRVRCNRKNFSKNVGRIALERILCLIEAVRRGSIFERGEI